MSELLPGRHEGIVPNYNIEESIIQMLSGTCAGKVPSPKKPGN